MKIRTTKYILKEGLINSYRNILMSLASVSIVAATLIIFGVFFLLIANFNYNLNIVKSQPEMVAYCEVDLDGASIAKVEQELLKNEKIESFIKVSKEEYYQNLKKMFKDDADLLKGMEDRMPISYIIKVKDLTQSKEVKTELEKIKGISSVNYSQDIINILTKVSHWMKIISAILTIVLLIVCMLIIANTIRITVYARRREINIMKYIGATDWFIRWPFIVEGAIISIVGALIAFAVVAYGYSVLSGGINSDISKSSNMFYLLRIDEVALRILGVYLLIGVTVGVLGSAMSLRKHLNV